MAFLQLKQEEKRPAPFTASMPGWESRLGEQQLTRLVEIDEEQTLT
jgi:hypothetical protein